MRAQKKFFKTFILFVEKTRIEFLRIDLKIGDNKNRIIVYFEGLEVYSVCLYFLFAILFRLLNNAKSTRATINDHINQSRPFPQNDLEPHQSKFP